MSTISNRPPVTRVKFYRRWAAADDALLYEMFNAGVNANEIGQRLNRTATAVYGRLAYLENKRSKSSDADHSLLVPRPNRRGRPRGRPGN